MRDTIQRAMAESVAFDRAAGYYDATRGFPPGVETGVADLFVAAGGLGPRSRVLEIGIGTGRIALPLAERVGRVVGVDLSAPMLAQLVAKRGARPIDLVRADGTRLPVADASADAVIAVHVFHLVPGWRAGLAELARALRPDGLLLHGGDDHPRGTVWASWRSRVDAQFGVENVGVPRASIETFPELAGWRLVGERRLDFSRLRRPCDLVASIEARTWSLCWRMSDTQIAEAAAALRADLLEAFGDLERPVEIQTGFWVRAYRPPA